MSLTPEQIRSCAGHLTVLDTETTGLKWYQDKLIGIGIHCPDLDILGYENVANFQEVPYGKAKSRKVWKGAMDYSASKRGKRLMETVTIQPMAMTAVPCDEMAAPYLEALQDLASDPQTTLLGHNLKFDLHFTGLKSWELPCKILDTSVMIHLYDSRLFKSMAFAESHFLGKDSKRAHVSRAPKMLEKKPWMWPPEVLADYCCNDCVVTYQLAQTLMPLLKDLGTDMMKLLALQMRYLRLLQKIENYGILIEERFCLEAMHTFSDNLAHMEQDLYDSCGKEFNWQSPMQLSKAIYEDLGIPKPINPFADEDGVDRTRFAFRGQYNKSATSSFLLMEKAQHPLGNLILDMRESNKLRDYAEKYILFRDNQGILHASFRQTGTRTGRLSSAEPNLQNIPSEHRVRETQSVYTGGAIRSGEYNLRQALVARPGTKFVSIDHRQQEMRMFGILAQEPVMLEALRQRKDIHLEVALAVWGDCGPEGNALHREWSKTIGFGLIYGMTTGSLEHRLNKPRDEAIKIAEDYWAAFPRIQPWLREVMETVAQDGYVRYWSGRIWREEDPDMFYKGANAQIQGGSADLMSIALMRADQVLEKQGWGHLVSIIHDECLFEILDEYVEICVPILARVMECPDLFDLPFATDAKVGPSYGSLEKYPIPTTLDSINWREYA